MTPKMIVFLTLPITVVLLLSLSYWGYEQWQQAQTLEATRMALAVRLNLPESSPWETLNHHVDCELIQQGMTPQNIESILTTNVGAVALNPPRRFPEAELDLVFPNTGLQRRRYFFEDEKLREINWYEEVNLDTIYTPVVCP